jgi:drug/metabolite transporter (DMT)-like permease
LAALACVCFFWGTTYVGIRVALESFSPAMLMCLRYSISGGALLIGALVAGARFPTLSEARRTAFNGLMTIAVGTGCLAYSEQWISSGMASLFASLQPFWLVGTEALAPGGDRLHWPSIGGMLVGLAGVALLMAPGAAASRSVGTQAMLGGFFLMQFGGAVWSMGSIAQRRMGSRAHPFVSGGVQQLATGIAFALPAFLDGRHETWNNKGLLAILYLAVFGGIVGYSAFIYAMQHLPVALVSIYTYINPMVAVALGWWFYREPFGWREAVAMVVIFAGVAIVKWTTARNLRSAEASVPIE